MSNVREYLKNRGINKQSEDDYEYKIKVHQRKVRLFVFGLIMVAVLLALSIKIYIDNMTYDDYEVSEVYQKDQTSNCSFYKFDEGMLRFSNDGLTYLQDDISVWNQAFEMKTPLVDICGSCVAIADMNTNVVYIYDSKKLLGKVETTYPIIDIEVSEQGVIAAITQDSETNRIEVIQKDGTTIANGQTYLTKTGCPLSISLSNDGTKLVASYVYIDGGKAKTRVVFYNYSEVGKNEVGRVVGGFEKYGTTIVPKVEFVDNDTVVAFGDDMYTVYSMKQKPSEIKEGEIKGEINSIFYNNEYFGMILLSEEYDEPYIIKCFDKEGNEEFSMNTDFDYKNVSIEGEIIVLNNSEKLKLITTSGTVKFEGKIESGIKEVIPTSKSNIYYIINDNNIEKIKLK